MANTLIAHPVLSDAAVLTTSATVAASMPLANLQKPQPTDRCRFTDLSQVIEFDVDLTAAMASTGISQWRLVVLTHSNASDQASWRIRAATTQAGLSSSPPVDTTMITFWPAANLKPYWERIPAYYLFAADHTETWIRITIDDSDNPDGFLEFGCLCVANPCQPELPRKFGEMPDDTEDERVVRAEGGPEYPRASGPVTVFNLTFQAEGEGALEEVAFGLRRIKRLRGASRPVIVIDDVDDTVFAMEGFVYGRMTNPTQTVHPQFQQYEVSITLREMR